MWSGLLITVGKLTGQAGSLTLLNCYTSCWHRSQNPSLEVGLSNSWLYPVTGTLGHWCFAGRLLPVLNTQHSNTFVSLAHLRKEMFPFGQKFYGEAFKRVVLHLVLAKVFVIFVWLQWGHFGDSFTHLYHPSGKQHSWNSSKAAAVPLVEVGTRLLLDVF